MFFSFLSPTNIYPHGLLTALSTSVVTALLEHHAVVQFELWKQIYRVQYCSLLCQWCNPKACAGLGSQCTLV